MVAMFMTLGGPKRPILARDDGIRGVFPPPMNSGAELQTLLWEAGPPGELTHLAHVMGGYSNDESRPQAPLDAETSLWGRPREQAICP